MENIQSVKQRFGIIGRSEKLDNALSTAIRVASTDLSVLISGESGVGKEAFSKIIHSLSARKHNKFIAINCGAIPEGTINSELFGHEKGAFTGATSERKGYFETYDGGTIFLDEIGEMPLDTQAFLLRVLESGEFIRVGSSKVQRTDVRVIAATNVDLNDRVRKGKFREDLYYRLNTVPIHVPALRERQEDIYMLFRKFAVDFAEKYRTPPIQLDDRAKLLLENYSWPGNIRELKNVAEQLSVLAEERMVTAEHLLRIIPNITERHLPMIPDSERSDANGGGTTMQEREILYKLLFEMKNDLSSLKSLIQELIVSNNLRVSDSENLRALQVPTSLPAPSNIDDLPQRVQDIFEEEEQAPSKQIRPVIIEDDAYDSSEIVEESLSLEENEKELIRKALRKHNGKRKEAAEDLGISERTLYRKIKEYDLQ